MRLYIAGPMTGKPNLNYETFNEVSHRLTKMGHEVYNPATTFNGDILNVPYDIYLREAIRLVTMVNGMVLLEGWTKSTGALTEVHIGLSLGMPFYNCGMWNIYQTDIRHQDLIVAMEGKYGIQLEAGDLPVWEAEGREIDTSGSVHAG